LGDPDTRKNGTKMKIQQNKAADNMDALEKEEED
jgi:hypothetical protein